MLNGLDLFSGIGGTSAALSTWVRSVSYCEQDTFCQSVLLSRMHEHQLDWAPIFTDVRCLRATDFSIPIDIVTAGFPCQDISCAGTGRGLEGERSGLVFEIFRILDELSPSFAFLENVSAIRTRGGCRIGAELASLGYDCRWCVISAAEVGAVHIRQRWFLLAHANSQRLRKKHRPKIGGDNCQRSRPLVSHGASDERGIAWPPKGFTQPTVDRTGDGISNRLDRHRALGNSIVPIQARAAFQELMGL